MRPIRQTPSRTWAFDSAKVLLLLRPRAREFGQGAFADRLPLELGQCREDAEHEARPAAAAVVVSISALYPVSTRRPTPRADTSCTVLTKWAEGATEAVELPDDEHVARLECGLLGSEEYYPQDHPVPD